MQCGERGKLCTKAWLNYLGREGCWQRGRSPEAPEGRLFGHACVAEREPKAHRGFAAQSLHYAAVRQLGTRAKPVCALCAHRPPRKRGGHGGSSAAARASPRIFRTFLL